MAASPPSFGSIRSEPESGANTVSGSHPPFAKTKITFRALPDPAMAGRAAAAASRVLPMPAGPRRTSSGVTSRVPSRFVNHVEVGTSSYYSALGEAAREPVLRDICKRIAADEFRHYTLFYRHLKRYLDKERIGRVRRVLVALGRITETEDDELAFLSATELSRLLAAGQVSSVELTRLYLARLERFDPLRFVIDPALTAAGIGDEAETRDLLETRLADALTDTSGQLAAQNVKNQKLFDNGRVSGMARALASVARSLNSVRGRKQVILFSEGFDSRLLLGRAAEQVDEQQSESRDVLSGRLWLQDNDNRYGNTELQGEVNRALEEFRRADCVIQSVDIGGLRAAADVSAVDRGAGREALFFLANDTGGELFEAANDLRGHLERVLEHTSVTYLLTFERSDLKEDGAYRRLRVKATLPSGARLTHRSGYYAPRPFEQLDPLERNLLASEGIATATPKNDLDLSLLIAPFRAGPQMAYVPVIIEVGGEALLSGQKGDRLAVEDTHDSRFTEHTRKNRNTEIDGLSLQPHPETAILRHPPFGDIQIRHHFQPRNQRRMEPDIERLHCGNENPIDPQFHLGRAIGSFNVNVAGATLHRAQENRIQ